MKSIGYYLGFLALPSIVFFGVVYALEFFMTWGNVTISNLLITLWMMMQIVAVLWDTPNWLKGSEIILSKK